MSLQESVDRLKRSRVIPDYYWFEGSDIKDLFETVEKEGIDNIRLKAFPGLDENGFPDLWFEVVEKSTGEPCGTYNASHPCPPFCPNGG